MNRFEEAQTIDHAILSPEVTQEELLRQTREAVALRVGTICVNPVNAAAIEPLLENTDTTLCVVADFPFGQSTTASRVAQIRAILDSSSPTDIDLLANYALLKDGNDDAFIADLKACREAAHDVVFKVILEVDALTEDEVRRGVRACIAAGADYAKTSSGFYPGGERRGATPEVVKIMLDEAGDAIHIKASGGIRTRERFLELLEMGAKKIGASGTPILLGDDA